MGNGLDNELANCSSMVWGWLRWGPWGGRRWFVASFGAGQCWWVGRCYPLFFKCVVSTLLKLLSWIWFGEMHARREIFNLKAFVRPYIHLHAANQNRIILHKNVVHSIGFSYHRSWFAISIPIDHQNFATKFYRPRPFFKVTTHLSPVSQPWWQRCQSWSADLEQTKLRNFRSF